MSGLFVLIVAGCTAQDGAAGRHADSSDPDVIRVTGVESVTITDLSASPHIIIGQSGRSEYEFHQVLGLMPLDAGGVAVIDASRQMRYFDVDGRLVTAAGGPGEGPGEFANPVAIQRIGDLLGVVDMGLGRVTLFNQNGTFAGVLQGPPRGRPEARENVLGSVPGMIVGILADSTFVGQGPSYFLSEGNPGWRRVVGPLRMSDPHGSAVADLGEVAVMQYLESPGEPMPIRTSSHAPMMSIDVLHDRVAFTLGDAYEVVVHAAGGERLVYREDRQRVAAPDRARPDERPYTQLQPAYAQVVLDPDSALLVRDYQIDGDAAQVWTLIESHGSVRWRYRMPPGFRLFRSWKGVLYGVWTDDMGVERIGWIRPNPS